MDDLAVRGQGVVEALVPLDVLLDRGRGAVIHPRRGDGVLELVGVVHLVGTGGTRRVVRLQDDGVADLLGELADLFRRGRAGGLGARHVGLAQYILHRRLVAAEEGRADGGARDLARLAHARERHHVRLDGALEPVDPGPLLEPANGGLQRGLVHDGRHLLVVAEPALQVSGKPLDGRLPDRDDVCADFAQRTHELTLILGKGRFEEDDTHGR